MFQALLPTIVDKVQSQQSKSQGDETENAGMGIQLNYVNQHDIVQTRKKYDESIYCEVD